VIIGSYAAGMIEGTGLVGGATLQQAETNMREFVRLVAEQAQTEGETRGYAPQVGEPVRDEGSDADGRFGWMLPVNGAEVRVLMPGVDLGRVKGLDSGAPCLFVDGTAAWWSGAIFNAVPLPK
jgi:hypothetical protein